MMIAKPLKLPRSAVPVGSRRPIQRFRHVAMACEFELLLPGRAIESAHRAALAAFDEVDRLEQELSRFVPTSDISRINSRSAAAGWHGHAGVAMLEPPRRSSTRLAPIRVGLEALECLQLAAAIHAETGGAFDVTVGGLGGSPRPDRPWGMRHLRIDAAAHTVTPLVAGLQVDLGGIGKGYALDRAAEMLAQWGVRSGLIHAGASTVLVLGAGTDEDAWTVELRDPDGGSSRSRVRLRSGALSGSGNTLHGPHILDPRTGQPASQAVAAWATAPSAALADALSTAFMVMSPAEVQDYCARHDDVSAALALGGPDRMRLAAFGREFDHGQETNQPA